MDNATISSVVIDFARAPNDTQAIVAGLREAYQHDGLEGTHIRDELYPPLPPEIELKDWQYLGTRYTIELGNGQSVSLALSAKTGEVIERGYTDRGDIHTEDVIKEVRTWIKRIKQAQHGGRKKTGMRQETQDYYDRVWQSWQLSPKSMTENQFCRKHDISRRTLIRILAFQSQKQKM